MSDERPHAGCLIRKVKAGDEIVVYAHGQEIGRIQIDASARLVIRTAVGQGYTVRHETPPR